MNPSISFLQRSFAFAVTLSCIAGCGGPAAQKSPAEIGRSIGLVAPLRGLGSAVFGKVRVVDRGDGIEVLVSAGNMPSGEYRVAFHQNGNCSSNNGFSAGPAWAPPGLPATNLIPPLVNVDGNTESSVHVSGVHTTGENGLAGRSVILYVGRTIPAQIVPGVNNNAFACGVFEPAQVLF